MRYPGGRKSGADFTCRAGLRHSSAWGLANVDAGAKPATYASQYALCRGLCVAHTASPADRGGFTREGGAKVLALVAARVRSGGGSSAAAGGRAFVLPAAGAKAAAAGAESSTKALLILDGRRADSVRRRNAGRKRTRRRAARGANARRIARQVFAGAHPPTSARTPAGDRAGAAACSGWRPSGRHPAPPAEHGRVCGAPCIPGQSGRRFAPSRNFFSRGRSI